GRLDEAAQRPPVSPVLDAINDAREAVARGERPSIIIDTDDYPAPERPPVSPEVDRLRAQVEAAREAWWSGTEQGDTGLVYTDRIEDAMDAIWDVIGHADWTARERPPVSPEQREEIAAVLFDADEHHDGTEAAFQNEAHTIDGVHNRAVARAQADALL